MKKIYQTPVVIISTVSSAPIVTYSLGDDDFKDSWDEEDGSDTTDPSDTA